MLFLGQSGSVPVLEYTIVIGLRGLYLVSLAIVVVYVCNYTQKVNQKWLGEALQHELKKISYSFCPRQKVKLPNTLSPAKMTLTWKYTTHV